MTIPKERLFSASFAWLNAAQFLGAFNDNVFKLFLIFFLIGLLGPDSSAGVLGTVGVVFVLPFLLFTPAAGVLADRVSKSRIVVAAKVLEVAVMLLGVAAFALRSPFGLYATMFLMAAQSALFGPAKLGIIPELVRRDRLSQANSVMTMLTFVAIILGSAMAPLIGEWAHGHYARAQWFCIGVAVLGAVAALLIKRTPAVGAPTRFSPWFIRDAWRTLWSIRGDRYLLLAVIASAYFLFLGAFMQMNLISFGMEHLGLSQERSAYLFFVAAVGIALGALAAGRLSGRNIEFGIVPLGALALTVAAAAIYFVPPRLGAAVPLVFVAGLGAGLFTVPLDAFIQFQAPPARRGEILATSGFLGWVGVALASALVFLLPHLGMNAAEGFLLMSGLTLVLTVAALIELPDFLVRFLLLLLTRAAYRIRVVGRENVPIEGGALLVCNHVSYLDALLLGATQQRRLRFIMTRQVYESWRWARPFFRLLGVIPIEMTDPPRQIVAALQAARAAMDDGYMVCIFAEGALTRTGTLREFRRGFERIVKGTSYPILPVYIGGAWGSIASYYHGQLVRRWTTLLRYPVTVMFGRPLPSTAMAPDVREAVMELSCDYFQIRKATRRSLGEEFIRTARRRWLDPILADTTGRKLSYGHATVAALILGDRMAMRGVADRHVGIVLPPGVGAALANLAITLRGQVPVNLNFTGSEAALRSAADQCGIRHVVTARAFLEKMPNLKLPGELLLLEDLLAGLTRHEKVSALLRAWLCPPRRLAHARGFTPDDVATVIFSSGSTGAPKGVMLSHHNIQSNLESLRIVFSQSPRDKMCAALPLFHSLGYTATLWYPVLSGLPAIYHPNPLDGAGIAAAVRDHRATMLFATPTFLALYMRKARREDFATLKYVVVGAEKLKPRLALAFEQQFGIRPLEGYGATELAPVAALSLPHVSAGGVTQSGWKEDSVGQPLPGVAVKIVDPETNAALPTGQPGLMLIKGPNVMLGYLGRPDLTAAAIQDGWYRTGDMARMDEDGFIVITDRLARFSKIGGEMVPHQAVEEEIQSRLGRTEQVVAVAAAPDEKKGERLVLFYTPDAGPVEDLRRILAESSLPNLWKPAPDAMHPVPALPVLGTGKLDLATLKEWARQRGADPASP